MLQSSYRSPGSTRKPGSSFAATTSRMATVCQHRHLCSWHNAGGHSLTNGVGVASVFGSRAVVVRKNSSAEGTQPPSHRLRQRHGAMRRAPREPLLGQRDLLDAVSVQSPVARGNCHADIASGSDALPDIG